MTFVNRPTTRRKLANMIVNLANKLNEAFAPLGVPSGKVFYLNNASGMNGVDDQAHGLTKALPFATLAYAIAQCTASAGDTIIAMEGHAESIIDAGATTGNDLSKIGISLIGVGYGSNRPTFTWATSTAATLTISAASVRVSNCIFDLSLPSALVSGFVVSAANCKIDNCTFLIGTAGAGTRPLQAILTTAGANFLEVSDCRFIEPSATPTTVSAASCAIKIVGGQGLKIVRNFFCGWYTLSIGAINGITTLTSNIEITNNTIINQTGSATKGIVLLTGSTGAVNRNIFGIASGTAPITGDAVWWGGNWSSAAVAANGTLV